MPEESIFDAFGNNEILERIIKQNLYRATEAIFSEYILMGGDIMSQSEQKFLYYHIARELEMQFGLKVMDEIGNRRKQERQDTKDRYADDKTLDFELLRLIQMGKIIEAIKFLRTVRDIDLIPAKVYVEKLRDEWRNTNHD